MRKLLEKNQPQGQNLDGYIVEHDIPWIGHRKMRLNARRIVGKNGNRQLILLDIGEVTEGND